MHRTIPNLHRIVFCVCLLILFHQGLEAAVIHVPGDYPVIQDAVDAASNGDLILVEPGTYTGPGNRDIDFHGKTIVLRGLKGPEQCVIDCEKSGRGFVFTSQENRDARIIGFTVINGQHGSGSGTKGHGIFIQDSSLEIVKCVIRNCGFLYTGDGVGPKGGGICVEGGNPLFYGCFIEESVGEYGGGIYCASSIPEIIYCTIRNNQAAAEITPPELTPYWHGRGGGLYMTGCQGSLLKNCVIYSNSAKNEVDLEGSGLEIHSTALSVENCSFVQNKGDVVIHAHLASPLQMENTVVYHNVSYLHSILNNNGTVVVAYSDIQGGWSGTGNFDADPLFFDLTQNDLRLSQGSPCIDAGSKDLVLDLYFEDYENNSRILDGDLDREAVVDVGAHEFNNIQAQVLGDPSPGSFIQLQIRGTAGLSYMVLGGFNKMTVPPPWVNPFGYLLINPAPGLPPLVPLSTIPEDITWYIPPSTPMGLHIFLLPICQAANNAGNLGGYWDLTIQ